MEKQFECEKKCEFLKINGVTLSCNKCIKRQELKLTDEEKEKILVILNERNI